MPDLSLDEQDIVDLVEPGPIPRGEMFARSWFISTGEFDRVLDSLLSRDLLLGWKRTVKCRYCGGDGFAVTVAGERAGTCVPCDGTGSVEEQIIGVACSECKGETKIPKWLTFNQHAAVWVSCSRCSSTPTPGLDPGDRKA